MAGTATGWTPLPYQYSGRHIRYWKVLIVPVEKFAPGVTGKIQVGAEPGDSAQVSVPACAVPLADGAEPNAPDVELTDPLELALLHAARPMATATAPTARTVTGRENPSRAFVRAAPVPSHGIRVLALFGRVIWVPSFVNHVAQQPPGMAYGLAARWREHI